MDLLLYCSKLKLSKEIFCHMYAHKPSFQALRRVTCYEVYYKFAYFQHCGICNMFACTIPSPILYGCTFAKLLYNAYSMILRNQNLICSAWLICFSCSFCLVATNLDVHEIALLRELKCVNTWSGSHDWLKIVWV